MNLISPIKISLKYLLATKFRFFLTILGVVIGVASVIIIMAIGQSAQALILDQITGIGSNLIGVLPGASDEKGPPATAMGISITTLKYDDLEALRNGKNVPEAEDAAGYVLGTVSAVYNGTDLNTSFEGTTASYVNVENSEIVSGRFYTKDEETNMSRVAVLGANLVEDLFSGTDPIGKVVKLKEQNFTVIGVLKKRGSTSFGLVSQDDAIFVPLKTAQKLFLGIDHLAFIRLKVKNTNLISSAKANIAITLRERHDIDDPANDDFSVRDLASAVKIITQVTDVLRYFLLAIGTISLIVGGVGIMNIMLLAVNQRVREVGLRKAVGAKNSDVWTQFLIESIFISFLGGVIGIIIGVIISGVTAIIIQSLQYTWPFIISWQSIAVACLVSIIIGIIFGIYPAYKASKISPMEALRYE
ncbi:MAG: multidrug ABC transporter substrate-binding protein [Candidatus Moranbacteria bacterium CG23_combo_of_CG06-09_8_20_14_all_35_22]|nr:MAG: multidrug ABC transporter substrate-binding protein [Candidatus Moranbacteria bacterium CG23_combo_of_CG06-09_8_20_14_all_35_22]